MIDEGDKGLNDPAYWLSRGLSAFEEWLQREEARGELAQAVANDDAALERQQVITGTPLQDPALAAWFKILDEAGEQNQQRGIIIAQQRTILTALGWLRMNAPTRAAEVLEAAGLRPL